MSRIPQGLPAPPGPPTNLTFRCFWVRYIVIGPHSEQMFDWRSFFEDVDYVLIRLLAVMVLINEFAKDH